tara:strand:- start:61 stop:270 length:210 start_codon:yes stop_codon:yes gene_type:complete
LYSWYPTPGKLDPNLFGGIEKEAMEDAMAGHYDVLVVHKIDRFSRKLRLALEYFEKLGKAGVGFVSIEN